MFFINFHRFGTSIVFTPFYLFEIVHLYFIIIRHVYNDKIQQLENNKGVNHFSYTFGCYIFCATVRKLLILQRCLFCLLQNNFRDSENII